MATTQRQFPGQPVSGFNAVGVSLSAATTGNKRTYTCPAGRQAIVNFASVFATAGAATLQIKITTLANTVILVQTTTSGSLAGRIHLDAGETCTLVVSVLDAAGTFDGLISVEEYLAQ